MKTKSIIFTLIASMAFSMSFTSCKDMLSPDSERHSYEIASDTLYSYWGILRSMQNLGERFVILGECRGDLVDGTSFVSDSIKALLDFDMEKNVDGSNRYLKASDYYHVINSCNAYLEKVDLNRKTGTEAPYMLKEAAQVEAIRAWVYLQLIQVYGRVPFYTKALISTQDINAFMKDPNHQMADASNLADLLESDLLRARQTEITYGLPSYENYGPGGNPDCHSSKCMIPVNLILGDLFLTKGDKASCEKAAGYYYDYLSNMNNGEANKGHMQPGGPLPTYLTHYAYQGESDDRPQYDLFPMAPFTEKGAVSKTLESITAIPSSTNRLWGNVLRGVNDVFGFKVDISVTGNDSSSNAAARPTARYDLKQLFASRGYTELCKEQKIEYLEGTYTSGNGVDQLTPAYDDLVGDARQCWLGDQWCSYPNGTSDREKFVMKQNPGGAFTTVYPMIYRKAQVWLRFAEALNRAGYPSYAFAILKDGLCNNPNWIPSLPGSSETDYAVKDSAFVVNYESDELGENDKPLIKQFPELDDITNSPYHTYQSAYDAAVESGIDPEKIQKTKVWIALSYENFTDENCNGFLFYLDKREVEASKSKRFLKFNDQVFQTPLSSTNVWVRTKMRERGQKVNDPASPTTGYTYAMGIHTRGCGTLGYTHRRESVYDYVRLIQERCGLTKEQIYSGDYDAQIQDVIEDLIVDEEALELAFEGHRFFDLMRVAKRRGAAYLAERVAKRTGAENVNSALYSKLLEEKNWYFPLPNN